MKKRIDINNKLNYILFHPENCEDLPLLICLHGAGARARGNNIENLYRHGLSKILNEGKEIDAVVLCPQCPEGFVWNNIVGDLKELIDEIIEEFNIKPDRILLTGYSMGGYGTWEMALTYRNFFAAIAPVAGGGMAWRCQNLKTTPVIAYHGEIDDMVTIECSRQMVDAVNKKGGNAQLIVFEGKGHNDGIDFAYEETDLIEKLLKYRRTNFEYVPDTCEEYY